MGIGRRTVLFTQQFKTYICIVSLCMPTQFGGFSFFKVLNTWEISWIARKTNFLIADKSGILQIIEQMREQFFKVVF